MANLYNSDFAGKPVVRVQYNKLEHLHMITQGNLRTAAVDYFENDLRHDSRLLTTNAILQYCNIAIRRNKNELQFICAAPPALELLDLAAHALQQLGLARPWPFTHPRVALAISICSPMPLPPVLRAPLVSMFLRARFFCCRALLASALPAAIRLPLLAASRERCGTSTAAPRLLWLCGQRLLKLHCAVHADRGQLRGGPHTTRRGDGMTVATKH